MVLALMVLVALPETTRKNPKPPETTRKPQNKPNREITEFHAGISLGGRELQRAGTFAKPWILSGGPLRGCGLQHAMFEASGDPATVAGKFVEPWVVHSGRCVNAGGNVPVPKPPAIRHR